MQSSRLFSSFLLLLLTVFSYNLTVRAADDEADDYDVKARVVRISLIAGEVTLKRQGNTDWERARLNFPLVEGDTLSTDRDSRLEIQIDARNFVRLAPHTTMQIVALRDEGVALSVIEGTATVRLAKFDHEHEYFEVDAPRTTLAIEKKGLYRIDVPGDRRVRLTVRDGGSARIYSDTSGFALRDGRTAELVVEGDNSGDWEFVANNLDAIDDWVSDREKYLAQRLRYDTQYYDQYVWGAEELDAYGDWNYTTDYGWIWRPRTSVTNVYADWAPYRYGHWVWCPPYGWTWVGYEPWGWAPYHYGRWVFHGGYWAWCPRSAYYYDHSWWRPALVAFVFVGDNYCWYPLGYRQHDPHSRYYQNQPARLTALRSYELANLKRVNPVELRAVTSANAKQIGSEDLKPTRADGALARRVMGSEPLLTGLPARPPRADSAADRNVGRPARVDTSVLPPATGAATRTPGVQLDNELRRSRVLNGREARQAPPQSSTPTVDTPSGREAETRPTGAVTRPTRTPRDSDSGGRSPITSTDANEQRPDRRIVTPSTSSGEDRPTRSEPAANPDSTEKPMRGRERVEPARPERRSESPSTTYEPPQRSAPPSRVEAPPQRSEAPPQRSEPPPQRSEPPPQRSEPSPQRSEPPPQRSEPPPQRSEPSRSESPRSEPRSEAPSRPSRPDNYERPSSRSESPRSEPSRSESPRSEPSRSEPSRSEPSRSEPSRSEPSRSEPSRSEPARSEPRSEPARDPDSGRPSRPKDPRR